MSPVAKMNPEPIPHEPAVMPDFDLAQNMAGALLKGVERIAEVQKQAINVAVQQNNEMAAIFKKASEKLPVAPRLAFLDLAVGAFGRYAETQKQAIDFVVEQSRVWTDLVKDRSKLVKELSDSNSKTVKQTIENSLAVNKRTVENAATDAKATVDAVREQFGLGGAQVISMTDTLKKGIDTVVDAQKEVMELVAR